MSDWIPLVQTVLWVGLISYVLRRYSKQFESVFSSIDERIKKGGALKVGVLGVTLDVEAQTPEQQIEKSREEIEEVDPLVASNNAPDVLAEGTPTFDRGLLSEAYLIEDLALREIQEEYKVPIQRQVRIGTNLFDGFFELNEIPFCVEVKIASSEFDLPRLHKYLETFARTSSARRELKLHLIFTVIYRNKNADLIREANKLEEATSNYTLFVRFRCYSLQDLETKWRARISPN